ncbi:MAG TPA: amidohydrolase family protein [Acidimicrobiales bacterium]|nr:amidohydrolase family protein [Acidimicrobiales bacterium]
MLDTKIVGGTIVDGTGTPGYTGDVGISDGRVVSIGEVTEDAAEIVDATGCIVAPGLIDPHTHYDAQLFWDPYASPSNIHGVTTVIGGNCGFTIAPLEPGDGDYLRRLMAKVEGMDLAALENGLDWDWESFADWIGRLDGNIGVNAGFLVGHCAIRRKVMGADAVGQEASDEQIEAMEQLLAASIEAGGLGFSTGRGNHEDGNGDPVPSRWATDEEILRLCRVTGQHEGTTLEVILNGCLDKFADDEIEFITAMSVEGRRPVNWNVLTVDSAAPDRHPRQLGAGDYAASKGGRVVALTMPTIVGMNMSFGTFCAFNLIPRWGEVLNLPLAERMEKLRDPAVREMMDTISHSEEAGVFRRLADWGGYRIGDTFSDENKSLERRYVHEIAEERGTGHFDTLVDIVLADDLRTVLWPSPTDNDDASWALRQEVWDHPHAMLGGSDAGAHLDRMCGAPYGTAFLRDTLRGRKLVSLERAVQMLTSEPAELFGLRDRGVLREGAHADVFVFDPDEVGCEPIYLRTDLPGAGKRLYSEPVGVTRVMVNGVTTVIDGQQVEGALPGTLIKPGRDTETVLP